MNVYDINNIDNLVNQLILENQIFCLIIETIFIIMCVLNFLSFGCQYAKR